MGAPAWTARQLNLLPRSFCGLEEGGRGRDRWQQRCFEVRGGPDGLALTIRSNLLGEDERCLWWLGPRLLGRTAGEAADALNALLAPAGVAA